MGSRASYVIKKDGQTRAYGSHWRASSLMDDLLWGPEYATTAFEAQEELEEIEDIDGGDEGCALIDWDAKRMLWDFANCRVPVQRQLYNRMLGETWPGWTIAWAAGGNNDLFDHLGIIPDWLQERDEDDLEEDYEDEDDEYRDREFEEDLFFLPEPVEGPIADIDDLEMGHWLTIRDKDGTYRDYFGFQYDLDDLLGVGEALIARMEPFPQLEGPPSELLTAGGLFLDQKERVLWRWQGTRFPEEERDLSKTWAGWSFKDLPGGWQAQLEATGREAGELAGGHRAILGTTVDGLLCDSSVDPREMLANIAAIGHGVRNGCAGITLLVAVVGVGLSFWLESTGIAIGAGIVFVFCFLLTSWLWRRTSLALKVLDDVATSDTADAPVPDGMTVDQKREILDGVLARLGYPSIEQLQASGELANNDDDYEDDDVDDGEEE